MKPERATPLRGSEHDQPDRPQAAEETRHGAWHMTAWQVGAVALLLSFGLDQVSKLFVVRILNSGPIDLGILRLRLVANRGAFMGLPAPAVVLVPVTFVVVVLALRSLRRRPAHRTAVAHGLLAGGALGNLADRLISRDLFPAHAVVDWISVRGMLTFNLADVFLVIGTMVLISRSRSAGAIGPDRVG